MSTVTLPNRLREKCELIFERDCAAFYNVSPDIDGSSVYAGGKIENARLAPTIMERLIACVEAADDAIAQIKDQRGLWPAEVDTLEGALSALRKAVGEKC